MKKLERSLSLPYVVAIAIGGMLGSGLFVLPGLAAAKTGGSVWLAYLIGAFCVLPAALSKSELATAMPTSGGTYVYIERAFGPMMGTISGLGLWLSLLLKSSFALVGFGAYLSVLTDAIEVKVMALLMLVLILVMNLFGIKKVGKVQLLIVVVSLAVLIILFFLGVPKWEAANAQPFLSHGTGGLLYATGFIFVSYAGVTKIAAIAEEIKNPNRNLPLAMMFALFLIGTVYTAITFILVGVIPPEELQDENKLYPIYTLANILGGRIPGIMAAVLGVVTLSSMANSGVLAASRFPFAMSRDSLLPPQLKRVHSRYLTPYVTIILTCSVMVVIILTLDVEKIAKLASAFMVMMFILVNASVIVLRETGVQWYKPSYKAPLYPGIQIFGVLSGIVLLIVLGVFALVGAISIVIAGIIVFLSYGRNKSLRKGVLRLYGHRPALFLLSGEEDKLKEVENEDITKNINPNLDGTLASNAHVVVPLFGKEHSPEMLVEIGGSLSQNSKIQTVHLTEVPEQTFLDAIEDNSYLVSLNRRIGAMSKEKTLDVDFDAAVTHDVIKTIHSISIQTHCKWLVLDWSGRSSKGLFIQNPLGWVLRHVDCNFALFKDNGVRYIRKIVVCLRPGKHDPDFLQVANEIASFYYADLTLMRVVSDDALSVDDIIESSKKLLDISALKMDLKVIKAKDPVQAIIKASSDYDLLIIGTPEDDTFKSVLFGKRDKLAEGATCSVLRLTLK